MNFNTINLFTLNMHTVYLDDIDNAVLLKEIEDYSGNIPNVKDPTPAHTFYEDNLYPFGMPESTKLMEQITSAVSSLLGKEMVMDSIWTITLERNQSVLSHTHKVNLQLYPEDYYSVSYYVNAPENSADLIFVTTHCNTIEKATAVKPEPGMLMIFNSFIPHMTNRHYSDEKRVVVSANLGPKYPNTNPSADWSQYLIPEEFKK